MRLRFFESCRSVLFPHFCLLTSHRQLRFESGAVVVGVPGQIVGRGTAAVGSKRQNGSDSSLPDPLGVSLHSLLNRVAKLEARTDDSEVGPVIRAPEAGVWNGDDFSI